MMRRREFLLLAGGAAACWSPPGLGQPAPIPTIGLLHSGSISKDNSLLASLRDGLRQEGYVEGQNVKVEYRAAEGQYGRLSALAAELVRLRVNVILAIGGLGPAKAAKAAASDVPIVFVSGGDPVKAGLVNSLNRPGGNVTGVSAIFSELPGKLLGTLHQLVPTTRLVGALVNPTYPDADLQIRELQKAAEALKQPIQIEKADTKLAINKAFEKFDEQKASAVLVANDLFLGGPGRDQIISLVAHRALPAIYFVRDFVEDGGLMSYGPSIVEVVRQAGIYVGKILHGAKPSDLPVMQPDKLELLINLRTAKALNIVIPPNLLVIADEVIE